MITTIKVEKETKERLLSLDFSDKNKTFNMIINDLINYYQQNNKKSVKDYKEWKKSFKKHKQALKTYEEEKVMWDNLLKWAKSKGFKC